MCVQGFSDVGKIEEFFDGGKDGHNQFSRMVSCLIDDVLLLEEFLPHQLPVVVM